MRICECEFRGAGDRSVFATLHPIVPPVIALAGRFLRFGDFAFQAKERMRARLPERANLFASKKSLRSLLSFLECNGTPYAQVLRQSGQRKPLLPSQAFKALPRRRYDIEDFSERQKLSLPKAGDPAKISIKSNCRRSGSFEFFRQQHRSHLRRSSSSESIALCRPLPRRRNLHP